MKEARPASGREAAFTFRRTNNISIAVRDGTMLLADIFQPDSEGAFPALVAFSPCPRQVQDVGAPLGFIEAGVIDTPCWADKPAGMFETASREVPLARAGRADEVADAIVFLAGNRFVTGIVLDVDGGLPLT